MVAGVPRRQGCVAGGWMAVDGDEAMCWSRPVGPRLSRVEWPPWHTCQSWSSWPRPFCLKQACLFQAGIHLGSHECKVGEQLLAATPATQRGRQLRRPRTPGSTERRGRHARKSGGGRGAASSAPVQASPARGEPSTRAKRSSARRAQGAAGGGRLRGLAGLRCQASKIIDLYCISRSPGLSCRSSGSCSA